MSTAADGVRTVHVASGWRATTALALASAGWAAVVLLPYTTVRILLPVAFATGILTMRRWPVLGASVICLGQAAGLALGAPTDSPAGLVAGLSAMVVLGRSARLPFGLLPVAGAWVVIVATDLSPVRQVLGLALFGAAFGVGYTLRTMAQRARTAEDAARELETVEVAARAREALEAERQRLTAVSTRLLAAATSQMQELARDARSTLDSEALARVRARGDAAVEELGALLAVLRHPTAPAPPAPTADPRRGTQPDWHADTRTAAVLWAMDLLIWGVVGGQATLALWDGVTIAAVSLRRRAPAAAVLVAAGGLLIHRFTGEVFVLGPALGVAVAVVVWSAVGTPTPTRLVALVPLAGAGAFATAPSQDGSLEVWIAIVTGTGFLSHAWHRLEVKHARASARSEAYERRVQLVVDSSLEHERLAVARDLHDLASGAIAVMMLHTAVADVTRASDKDAALTALDYVIAAGDAALEQLDLLREALGPPGRHSTAAGRAAAADSTEGAEGAEGARHSFPHASTTIDHYEALEGLATRARESGLDCRLEIAAALRFDDPAAVVWRVVNEGLTNALKHAPGSRVDVTVSRDGDELVVRVRDDGAGIPHRAPGTRLGLRGLSELLARHDGSLRHGPLTPPSTGFELEARLPDPSLPASARAVGALTTDSPPPGASA